MPPYRVIKTRLSWHSATTGHEEKLGPLSNLPTPTLVLKGPVPLPEISDCRPLHRGGAGLAGTVERTCGVSRFDQAGFAGFQEASQRPRMRPVGRGMQLAQDSPANTS